MQISWDFWPQIVISKEVSCTDFSVRRLTTLSQLRRVRPVDADTLRINHHAILFAGAGTGHFFPFAIRQHHRWRTPTDRWVHRAATHMIDGVPELDIERPRGLARQSFGVSSRIQGSIRQSTSVVSRPPSRRTITAVKVPPISNTTPIQAPFFSLSGDCRLESGPNYPPSGRQEWEKR